MNYVKLMQANIAGIAHCIDKLKLLDLARLERLEVFHSQIQEILALSQLI